MQNDVKIYDNFPLFSKLLNCEWPEKTGWKILAITGSMPAFLLGGVIDLVIMLVYNVGKWILHKADRLLSELAKIILEKFLAKVLAILAFLVTGFFVFFLIYTGTWKELLKFVSGFFS